MAGELVRRNRVFPLLAGGLVCALAAAAAVAPAGEPPLLLDDLLAEARARNPEIAAARARAAAAATGPSRAGALPDPWLTVGYQNDGLDAFTYGDMPDSWLSVSWSQELPRRAARRAAAEAASREADAAGRMAAQAEQEVLARVKEAFHELLRADGTREVLEEGRALLSETERSASSLYASGSGTLEGVLRAQTERTLLEAEVAGLAQEREAAAAALNALLGREPSAPVGPVAEPPASPAPGEGAGPAGGTSFEVLAAEEMVRRGEAELRMRQAEEKPDLMLTGTWMERGDLDPMVEGMVGIRIPAWGKRKQAMAVEEARARLEADRADAEARRLAALREERELRAAVARADRVLELYAQGIVPQARAALESASAAYAVGRADFLAVLDSLRTLLDARKEQIAQRAGRETALGRLEALRAGSRAPEAAGETGPGAGEGGTR